MEVSLNSGYREPVSALSLISRLIEATGPPTEQSLAKKLLEASSGEVGVGVSSMMCGSRLPCAICPPRCCPCRRSSSSHHRRANCPAGTFGSLPRMESLGTRKAPEWSAAVRAQHPRNAAGRSGRGTCRADPGRGSQSPSTCNIRSSLRCPCSCSFRSAIPSESPSLAGIPLRCGARNSGRRRDAERSPLPAGIERAASSVQG